MPSFYWLLLKASSLWMLCSGATLRASGRRTMMAPSADQGEFRSVLRRSRHIVAITGAGLSAASGIPTFRDAGGLWRSYDAMTLATPQAFAENPSRVWQFYHMRREKARLAEPNAAHRALAALSIPDRLKTIAPLATFTLVTQNVDGLSRRALESANLPDKTRPALFEMHGHLFDTVCTGCGRQEANYDSPICAALGGTETLLGREEPESDIPSAQLPSCGTCGCLLRPGVVWFGETPHNLHEIGKIVDEADLGLVIGTSSTVYPAASYAHHIKEHGGTVAVFNIQNTEGDDEANFVFLGPCEQTLPRVLFAEADD